MKHPRRGAGDDVSDLVAEIEAELSSGSRAKLQRLLAQLVPGDDEDEDLGDDFEDDIDDGDDLDDEDDEPGPGWWRYHGTPAAPIPVKGGLAAKSRRGAIGETWWSKRFLAAVETALVGGRSTRGRSYARRGQVFDLRLEPGLISARVQGTRRTPYNVRVAMPAAHADQWDRILASLASQAVYSASMLAGEMPHEIEEVFAAAGVTLFPSPSSRLSTDCSCPDWANPCKHVAAVCYLVAEHFDRDPFALLAWRGREREDILRRLRELRGAGPVGPLDAEPPPPLSAPPLLECLLGFWKAGPELASVHVRPEASEMAGAVLRQMPRGILEVRGRDLGEVLTTAYKEMAAAAQHRALAPHPLPSHAAQAVSTTPDTPYDLQKSQCARGRGFLVE